MNFVDNVSDIDDVWRSAHCGVLLLVNGEAVLAERQHALSCVRKELLHWQKWVMSSEG